MEQAIMKQTIQSRVAAFLALSFVIAGACSPVQLGASDANYAKAKGASEPGAALYSRSCASCHGDRGAGGNSGPAIMGAGALPEFPRDASDRRFVDQMSIQTQVQSKPPGTPSREPFRTAQNVFDYVSQYMPPAEERRLTEAEYWSVVTFMLAGHGVGVPDAGLNATNASSVSVAP